MGSGGQSPTLVIDSWVTVNYDVDRSGQWALCGGAPGPISRESRQASQVVIIYAVSFIGLIPDSPSLPPFTRLEIVNRICLQGCGEIKWENT